MDCLLFNSFMGFLTCHLLRYLRKTSFFKLSLTHMFEEDASFDHGAGSAGVQCGQEDAGVEVGREMIITNSYFIKGSTSQDIYTHLKEQCMSVRL